MNITIRRYRIEDVTAMVRIWNEIIEEGIAFPQLDFLTEEKGETFFAEQSYSGVAVDEETHTMYGLYIVHPNNVGRCGLIANASYAVASGSRGLHVGEKMVKDSLVQAKACGFTLMQFNAVVASNIHARHLYERLGFKQLGMIPHGFLMRDGHYENIYLYFIEV